MDFSRQPEAPHSRTALRWQEFREQHNGRGGSSYINDVIVRDRDANTDWHAASDGTLEERLFYVTNWRHDLVALLDSAGRQVEQVRYSASGSPFGLPSADTDSDGDCDTGDANQIGAWIASSTYDPRGDVDLDGDVDAGDGAIAPLGVSLGRSMMSGIRNRVGFMGARHACSQSAFVSARYRILMTSSGRWLSRDPIGYADGANLLGAGGWIAAVDPYGLSKFSGTEISYYKENYSQYVGWMAASAYADYVEGKLKGKAVRQTGGGSDLNAIRHCLLACMLGQLLGSDKARYLLDLHEFTDPSNFFGADTPLSGPGAMAQDLTNNAQGLACATKPLPPNCQEFAAFGKCAACCFCTPLVKYHGPLPQPGAGGGSGGPITGGAGAGGPGAGGPVTQGPGKGGGTTGPPTGGGGAGGPGAGGGGPMTGGPGIGGPGGPHGFSSGAGGDTTEPGCEWVDPKTYEPAAPAGRGGPRLQPGTFVPSPGGPEEWWVVGPPWWLGAEGGLDKF